ncbi:hypothetical protein [Ramlibacter sp. WS9]|nr:hypothetical protein [Ramlibacter sp. WS9]
MHGVAVSEWRSGGGAPRLQQKDEAVADDRWRANKVSAKLCVGGLRRE